ncbi:MAG: SUF system NifU family Fe-S cluster assembly protein [Candidatus Riflebacteria bacterium]|nr:SUF system NifU family Fe-S cluster assembly protein [Candidatus Riflebacteria bacterium]
MFPEPAVDGLYRELILHHYRCPCNRGKLDPADAAAHAVNPLCGDEIDLTLRHHGGTIADIRTQGRGCSISLASASMMTEAVKGRTVERAKELIETFKRLMSGGLPSSALPVELEELEALEGVRSFPVRIKCALLAWTTLVEALDDLQRRRCREPGRIAAVRAAGDPDGAEGVAPGDQGP